LAVDIDGLQVNGLGDSQARRVAGGQDGAVLGAANRAEELQNFLGAQNHGQLLGFLRRWDQVLERPILLERDLILESGAFWPPQMPPNTVLTGLVRVF
jgi:hypothetical protein